MSNPLLARQVQRGFSLLEVLVAFSVFSLSLGVLFQIFSSGLRGAQIARSYSHAIIIAESQLAQASIEDVLEPVTREGSVDDQYHWITMVSKYDSGGEEPEPGMPEAYRVSVRVTWGDLTDREIVLDTLRLMRVPE